jgi:hypothetical protein
MIGKDHQDRVVMTRQDSGIQQRLSNGVRAGFEDSTMLNMMKIALSAALVLSIAFTASAATEHRRATHAYSLTSRSAPDYCPPSGGPTCSDRCLPSGPPCRTQPDGW